ncbi:bifunctional phosphopantothenoylcysteine decarboxylase/phosphopantothenate--cysteine ligase CoaBC [Lacticaseibacillus zhaodongensis]|uniref:bifunctional phosphopantothenoylcysteine decarboxylase/phosphopantothenate--cysteine ligase CoaBC n=1 Tax=Lacticaseibacillus zhaodongensis TaxID=2668065 RepID=UPI0012D2BBA6|nr:bifunctional phosphopantothenoylcysteine decarboxylase/phosphopantothenate--cysteine ligase CoaBC [Lacticaseibacillus zhaodongensis]
MQLLKDKHIALYVTGSIAAYKAALLTRLFIKAGAQVQVVMTKAAAEFVTPLTFQTLSTRPVLTDLFAPTAGNPIKHIHIADWTDIAVVAPATADIIATMVSGSAHDAASSTLLATSAPLFVAPAMNSHMLHNAATQRNLEQLHADGAHVIDAAHGFLAEGYTGSGRFVEPEAIVEHIESYIQEHSTLPLSGKRVLITAGGTREDIDPVRYIGNKSSGKMGYALAQAAFALGAKVTLVSTVQRPLHQDIKLVPVTSAEQMQFAVDTEFPRADVTIMAAAVADFRPQTTASSKIKKQSASNQLHLDLVQNPDILAGLGASKRPGQFLIGFAAETDDVLPNAIKKLTSKNVDMLVANDVSGNDVGFNADNNRVTLLFKNGQPEKLATASKDDIAREILQRVAGLIN